MAIFSRERNSDERIDAVTDVRQQLEAMSAEQKRVFTAGPARANAPSVSPESPLSFSFRASSRPPESPITVQPAAPVAAARPAGFVPADTGSVTGLASGLAPNAKEPNDLIIRPGMTLRGELSSCERVVIQGHVEATITDCRKLEVIEDGIFKGSATVRDADIAGKLEGVLTVEGTLVVRATGRISGTVHYGRLAVEEGGVLRAAVEDISPVEASDQAVNSSSR